MHALPFRREHARRGPTVAGARVGALYERHGSMVYGLCRMLLRDPTEAEDATQQVFLDAYRSLLGGTVVRDGAAWLAAIARHECRHRARQCMREPLPLDEDIQIASTRGTLEEAERRLEADALRGAIAALPERQREAVVLRDLYGLGYRDVGAALGISRPAVETLLFRARRTLRVRLRPVAGVLVLPLAMRDAVAQAVPGFADAAGAGAGGAAAGAGAGLLAKLLAVPASAKVATATVAATAAGSAVAITSDHPPEAAQARAPITRSAPPATQSALPIAGGAGSVAALAGGARENDREDDDRDDRSSHGHRDQDDHEPDDRSGPGDGGPGDEDRSGPGGGQKDDDDHDDADRKGEDDDADRAGDEDRAGRHGGERGDEERGEDPEQDRSGPQSGAVETPGTSGPSGEGSTQPGGAQPESEPPDAEDEDEDGGDSSGESQSGSTGEGDSGGSTGSGVSGEG